MQRVGRYEILDELGRGATGIVYRARDPSIGRLLAIKTIRLASLGDPEEARRLRERLRREAHSAGILSHPGIVVVYDVGQEGELAYIAMELVPGRSLEAWLKAGQPLDRQLILSVLRQAAAALDYAHKKGVVHRDIKPANILIGEDGAAKITDFGVAKISSSEQLTMTGTVLGTPNYMSPEQIQGKAVDGRADQFALAVIAYEMLTGQKPFLADSLTAVLYKIVAVEPRAAHEVNPRLPWAASLVLGRALAKKPEDRYPSCGEFVSALERALESKQDWQAAARAPAEATATETLGRPIEQEVALPAERLSPAKARPRRRILAALLAGLGALAVGAAIYFGVEQWRSWSETGLPAPPVAPSPPAAPQTLAQATETAPRQPPAKPAEEKTAPDAMAQEPAPEQHKPEPAPVARKAPPSYYKLMVTSSPPGARVVFDGNAQATCKTPCTVTLSEGRHTLAARLAGHRPEMRIIELSGPREIFIPMAALQGTLFVESTPAGAQIILNGQLRQERTPARLILPAGKHRVEVLRNGERAQREIEVKESALVRVHFELGP